MINMCVCAQVCGRVCFRSRFQQTVNHLQVREANLQSRWPSRLPGCPLKRSGLWTEPSPSLSTDQAKKQNRNHGSYSHLSTSSLWCAAPAEAAAHESMRQLQHLWITLASWMGSGLLQGGGGARSLYASVFKCFYSQAVFGHSSSMLPWEGGREQELHKCRKVGKEYSRSGWKNGHKNRSIDTRFKLSDIEVRCGWIGFSISVSAICFFLSFHATTTLWSSGLSFFFKKHQDFQRVHKTKEIRTCRGDVFPHLLLVTGSATSWNMVHSLVAHTHCLSD